MSRQEIVAFLDANVLARPVTRTLLIVAAELSGYATTWSSYVEREADRHLVPQKTKLAEIRAKIGMDLSATGSAAERFAGTSAKDRQVLADAAAAHVLFLVTEDVDDFAPDDLRSVGIAAVNPDLFLAERSTTTGYLTALELMARGMSDPSRTPEELHVRIGRQHPLTAAVHAAQFTTAPMPPTHTPPAVRFRGARCLRCLKVGKTDGLGLCAGCE